MIQLIGFDTTWRVLLEPTKMTDDGRARLLGALQNIDESKLGQQTNLWKGLSFAVSCAQSLATEDAAVSVLVFSDGGTSFEPVVPADSDGEPTLVKLQRAIGRDFPATISCLGFGSSDQNSKLLSDISRWGGGIYAFCADPYFTCSIVLNYFSTMRTVVCQKATFNFRIVGRQPERFTRRRNLFQGSAIDFVFEVHGKPEFEVELVAGGKKIKVVTSQQAGAASLADQVYRKRFRRALKLARAIDVARRDEKRLAELIHRAGDRPTAQEQAAKDQALALVGEKQAVARVAFRVLHDQLEQIEPRTRYQDALLCDLAPFDKDQPARTWLSEAQGRLDMRFEVEGQYESAGRHDVLALESAHRAQICMQFVDLALNEYMSGRAAIVRRNIADLFEAKHIATNEAERQRMEQYVDPARRPDLLAQQREIDLKLLRDNQGSKVWVAPPE